MYHLRLGGNLLYSDQRRIYNAQTEKQTKNFIIIGLAVVASY